MPTKIEPPKILTRQKPEGIPMSPLFFGDHQLDLIRTFLEITMP